MHSGRVPPDRSLEQYEGDSDGVRVKPEGVSFSSSVSVTSGAKRATFEILSVARFTVSGHAF